MADVYLNCPVNMRRTYSEMLKDFARQFEQKNNIDIKITIQQRPWEPLLQKAFAEDNIPDMVIAHAIKLIDLGRDTIQQYFQPLPGRFTLRNELLERGFKELSGCLNLTSIVPFVIIYNRRLISEEDVPRSWKALMDSKWQGKITAPLAHHVVSKLALEFIHYKFPENYNDFADHTVFEGSPNETVISVDEGRYPLGIMNIAFARFSRNKNVGFIWPQDGALCSPQVMAFKKGADERMLEFGDFLLSPRMQEFFSSQDFVPVIPKVEMAENIRKNQCNFVWEGWDNYFQVLSEK